MKIIKKYALSEETLEKDIDRFIKDAKAGAYQFDYKYGMEGLKTIKAYFRMIEDEFKKQNFASARASYKKLMFLLLQCDYNYFDYEDIVGKLNFEKFIANYFTCLIKQCTIEELFLEYIQYLTVKKEYGFDSAHEKLILLLSKNDLVTFKSLVDHEAEKVKEKDYALYDLIYFLLNVAKHNKDRSHYNDICNKYKNLVGEEQKAEFDKLIQK